MRISDWSSDVCSSDLLPGQFLPAPYRAGQATLSTLPQRKRLRYFLSRELLQVECANRWECLPAGRSVREGAAHRGFARSEEHTSELQSLMRISYAVFCLKKKKKDNPEKTYDHAAMTHKKSHNKPSPKQ